MIKHKLLVTIQGRPITIEQSDEIAVLVENAIEAFCDCSSEMTDSVGIHPQTASAHYIEPELLRCQDEAQNSTENDGENLSFKAPSASQCPTIQTRLSPETDGHSQEPQNSAGDEVVRPPSMRDLINVSQPPSQSRTFTDEFDSFNEALNEREPGQEMPLARNPTKQDRIAQAAALAYSRFTCSEMVRNEHPEGCWRYVAAQVLEAID